MAEVIGASDRAALAAVEALPVLGGIRRVDTMRLSWQP